MSNVFKLVKKLFTVGVTTTTIVWSLGVAAFLPAAAQAAVCPTLNPGDMAKVTGKAPIYAVNNKGELAYFWSGDHFKTWRPTYGGYVSISQACFDSLKTPSVAPFGVNYHPGSAVLKRAASDQLWVMEPNNTIAKITPEAAKALYDTYKVVMLDDREVPNYVGRGAEITTAVAHPGMLVRNAGKVWYVNTDNKLQEVTDAGMTANGFQSKFVHTVPDSALSGLVQGDKIDGAVAALTDKTQSGGVVVAPAPAPGTPAVPGGALSVSLASDNPFAATIVSDSTTGVGAQAQIPVLKLVFTAGSDGDVKVTGLTLKRGGISADTDISNMYLYDGDTQLASNPTVASNMSKFAMSSGLFTVLKGTSKTVTVKLDLKNNTAAGKTFTFSVNANADVVSNSTAVNGTFPLMGNVFTSALVSDLGKLFITSVSPSAAGTVDPGTTGFELWRFTLANTNQDTELRKLKFTIVGSVNASDLQNFSVWVGGKQIGTTVAAMASDKTVMFDWTATPYVVTKGQTQTMTLRADVTGGTNRTFRASFQNSGDVITYDKNYGVFLKTNGTDSFTILQPNSSGTGVDFTVNSGTLTQTMPSDAPNGNVAVSATNVTFSKFLWKANGEDIKVSSLSVSSTISGSRTLKNVRLLVNGSQVGTTITTLTGGGAADTLWGTFGNSFTIKAGTQVTVTVVGDLTGTGTTNDTVVVGLSAGSSNFQGIVSLSTGSTVGQNGNTLTVRAGTVSISKNSSFGDKSSTNPNGTVNGGNVKMASFVITAGAGEDVDVSQIQLIENLPTATDCVGTYMQNLTLKDATGKQIGATVSSPATTCSSANTFTFNLAPAVVIVSGGQYAVDVFADMKSQVYTGALPLISVKASGITATGRNTGSTASYTGSAVTLQNNYISSAGTFMVQLDPDSPTANNYLMGAADQNVAKFKLTASSTEGFNITQLVVGGNFSASATGTMSNIRLIDNDAVGGPAQVGAAVPSFSSAVAGTDAATTTYAFATFSSLNLAVAKGATKSLSVKVDFTTYDAGGFATTGQTFQLVLLPTFLGGGTSSLGSNTITTVTANGASSGSTITPTFSSVGTALGAGSRLFASGAFAPTTTLYRARLSVAWASDTPTGLSSPNAAQIVAKFVISNASNAGGYVATVQRANVSFSTTISAPTGTSVARAVYIYKDAAVSANQLATTSFIADHRPNYETGITKANFASGNGLAIAAGTSKVILVTLDTTDAANPKSLSVNVTGGGGIGGIDWDDGISVSTPITAMGTDLPLAIKTISY